MNFDNIEDAILDIKNGKLVIVVDDETRENEGDLVFAAEKISSEIVNFMATKGRGLICVPVTEVIADKLGFDPMVFKNDELHKCNFTVSVDYKKGTTTGISASDRAKTIKAICDPATVSLDFARPGHVFPLRAVDGGVLVRAGHTEAIVDLCELAGLSSVGVICEIAKEDGEMMRRDDLFEFAKENSLKIVTIKSLIEYRRRTEKLIDLLAESVLPTEYGDFNLKIYKSLIDEKEHVVLTKGDLDLDKPVLVRVHSECMTSEVFHSLKCDCKEQLDFAFKHISEKGAGVILYMRQEGRGIGLANKVKAYALQDEGFDTVDANEKLGFESDLREYGIGAQILVDLGIKQIDLMTNNPKKIIGLDGYGLEIVERIPIEVEPSPKNIEYLKTKKRRMGHHLRKI